MSSGPETVVAKEPKPKDRTEPTRVDPQHHRLHPPERRVAVWGPLVAVTVLAAIIILGIWRHVAATQSAEEFARQTAETVVNVQAVHRNPDAFDLTLPGSVQAFQATTLYARSNGFLGKWLVDIGDNVTKGQTLAIIETPDLDQQLRQAQSTLNQARANFEIARVTAARWQELFNRQVVSAQDNDQQQSNYQAAAAAMAAAQASVNQLQQLVGFNQIIAPFDGRITNRYLDVGALVSAGSGAAGTAVYDLQQTDPLRIYVYVPQSNAPMIHDGMTAQLVVRGYPGHPFPATVTRTAGAIDPNSRTLLTELIIPNREGTLYAGIYGEIRFTLRDSTNAQLIVPANAYMFRPEGAQVVVVRDNKIHWQTIQVGRDYGTMLEAAGGLNDGDLVVVNPSDDLQEGMQVKTQAAPVENASGGSGASSAASPTPTPHAP
jgi:RND family efflux transporter MFP subunit